MLDQLFAAEMLRHYEIAELDRRLRLRGALAERREAERAAVEAPPVLRRPAPARATWPRPIGRHLDEGAAVPACA